MFAALPASVHSRVHLVFGPNYKLDDGKVAAKARMVLYKKVGKVEKPVATVTQLGGKYTYRLVDWVDEKLKPGAQHTNTNFDGTTSFLWNSKPRSYSVKDDAKTTYGDKNGIVEQFLTRG